MLTHIDVNGVSSENSFTVPFVGATPKDSLLIRKITGLNPPDINLFVGDYSRDGGIYQGRRVGVRNVVITMELNPNPALGQTISSLRELLYRAFIDPLPVADYLKLNVHLDDGRNLYLVGYTEKIETEIFSAENLVQISVICPDPYLRDESPIVRENSAGWTILPITYTGTAEAGLEIEVDITSDTSTLTLADNTTLTNDPEAVDYYQGRMIINYPFVSGDKLLLRTVRGSRYVEVKPASDPTNQWSVLGSLTPTSQWLELHSRASTMKVYGETSADLVAGITKLAYTQSYWGI